MQGASHPAPGDPVHQLHAVADRPLQATITTLDVDQAKLVGLEIVCRHEQRGSFHQLKKRNTAGGKPRAASSRFAIFQSMAIFHPRIVEHYSGVYVKASPEELADSVGLEEEIVYPVLRDLEAAGLIIRIKRTGRGCDHFFVPMPPPIDAASVEGHTTLARAPLHTRGLDSLSFHTRVEGQTGERARPSTLDAGFGGARALDTPDPALLEKERGAWKGARAPDSPLMQCNNALHCNEAQEEEGEKVKALRDQGFDMGAAIALARDRRATMQRILIGIAYADDAEQRGAIRKSRQAIITNAIKRELPPPETPAERQITSLPEHLQEDRAREVQRLAQIDAAARRIREALAPYSDEQLATMADARLQAISCGGDANQVLLTVLRKRMEKGELRTSPLWASEWSKLLGIAEEAQR